MARPDQSREQRGRLLPVVARTFAELGYRRATTAELARRCGVQENILYRLWTDKKAMFLASIDFVYEHAASIWEGLARRGGGDTTLAERLLGYEADHHGEFGLYRIVFAGLTETDDPEVRRKLLGMYRRFHGYVAAQIEEHRARQGGRASPDPELAAWGFLGLGTLVDIVRELRLAPEERRRAMFEDLGRLLLDGTACGGTDGDSRPPGGERPGPPG